MLIVHDMTNEYDHIHQHASVFVTHPALIYTQADASATAGCSYVVSAAEPSAARGTGSSKAHQSVEALCSAAGRFPSQSLPGRWLSAGLFAPGPQSPVGSCPSAPSGGGSRSAHLVAPVRENPARPTSVVTSLVRCCRYSMRAAMESCRWITMIVHVSFSGIVIVLARPLVTVILVTWRTRQLLIAW